LQLNAAKARSYQGTQDPEDAVADAPVIHASYAARLIQQIWLDGRPPMQLPPPRATAPLTLRPILTELSGQSLRAIASELNARGIPAARGGKWSVVLVSRLVSRLAEAQPGASTMNTTPTAAANPVSIIGLTALQSRSVEAATRMADAVTHDGIVRTIAEALVDDPPTNAQVRDAIKIALAINGVASPFDLEDQ
jgi:hypothetical protein